MLGALAVAAEALARSILPGVVRGIVVEQLDLPAEQKLEVQAAGVLLPQLIAGRLDALHLSSDEVTLEGITGFEITRISGAVDGASTEYRVEMRVWFVLRERMHG